MASWTSQPGSSTNPFEQDDARAQQSRQPSPSGLERTQAQVNEVVSIMQSNVTKVMERDSRLAELDARADALNMNAAIFERHSKQVRRRMWWRNLKWAIILGLVVIAVIIIISVWIASEVGGKDNNDQKALPQSSGSVVAVSNGNQTVSNITSFVMK